jgi:type VI secretion system protein ImpC
MIEIDVQTRRKAKDAPSGETPFRMLVVGDFGAPTTKPVLVNRDNFDATMKKLGVELDLGDAGVIPFEQLDDFHPDELYRRVPLFQTLRDARKKSDEPEVRRVIEAAKPATEELLQSSSLLEMAVAQTEGAPSRHVDPFLDYVERLVAPYTVAKPDPKQEKLLQRLEAAMSGNMRAILHHPEYQVLEAAWRGLDFLTRAIDDDVAIKVYIYSISKERLAADLNGASDLRQTALFQILVEQAIQTPGAPRWSVIAGNFTVDPNSTSDVELLGRMALIASVAGAPFLTAGTPDPELWLKPTEYWSQLTQIPESAFLGVILPRFLARLPYGKKQSEIESFDFEELPERKHEHLLWANPIWAALRVLAADFAENNWRMTFSDHLDIQNLPAHLYEEDGEKKLTPCAELLITQATATALMENGLMPLLSMKNADHIRLAGFRSISGHRLAGPWN